MRKLLNKIRGAVAVATASVAAVFGFSTPAMAAVPTEVSDALTASATDVGTVASGVVLVVITIMTFRWIKRAFS